MIAHKKKDFPKKRLEKIKCSQEKETAMAVLESSTDSSNQEDGNATEERDQKLKLFESAASGSSPSKDNRW